MTPPTRPGAPAQPWVLDPHLLEPHLLELSVADVLMAGLDRQLEVLEALTGAITARTPVQDGDDVGSAALADASVRVRRCEHRLQAQRLGWLCRVEADGMWALQTLRTFPQWVAWTHDCTVGTARREVRLAHVLRDHLPVTAARARAGLVGSDHVRALADVAATSPARCEALAAPVPQAPDEAAGDGADLGHGGDQSGDGEPGHVTGCDHGLAGAPAPVTGEERVTGEEHLLGLAQECAAGEFRRVVRHFAAITDPDADERGFADAVAREYVDLSPTMDGYHLAGFLTTEHGQTLSTALRAVMGVPAAGDLRSAGQRRARGLVDVARIVLDQGLAGTSAVGRPHLSVHVSWTELQHLLSATGADRDPVTGHRVDWPTRLATPPARWEDGTGPVPAAVLKRLACAGELTRIVFGPESQVLDVGRRQRTFTGALRRAIIARDGVCTWPGCDAPPQLGEIHHAVQRWADGGGTSTDTGALLCWYHHDHVDTHGITMRRHRGRWRFHRPDGTPAPEHPPPRPADARGRHPRPRPAGGEASRPPPPASR